MGKEIRLADRLLTLRRRRDAFLRDADKKRVADATKAFLADAFTWTRDDVLMRELCGLLGLDGAPPPDALFKVRRAIEIGDIVAIPDPPRYAGTGSRGSSKPKPCKATFTPSQLFKGPSRVARVASHSAGPAQLQMPPNDWLTLWEAKPGGVLPDGRIATALNSARVDAVTTVDGAAQDVWAFAHDTGESTLLSDAPPFDYQPDMPGGDSFDIAKTPNLGDPGAWYTNPGSGQMRLYGDGGKPVVDLDFDHLHNGLRPHAHNWNNGVRDGGDDVVPFSPWSP